MQISEKMHFLCDKLKSRDIYKQLLNNKIKSMSNTHTRYTEQFKITNEEWKDIFTLPIKVITLNTIRELQFKIIYRFVPTNNWLHKCKQAQSG